jgi:methyl-accepting chemotaxis protein
MKWFDDRSTRTKLVMGFAAVALVLATVGVYELRTMADVQARFADVYDNRLLPLQDLGTAQEAMMSVRARMLQHVIEPDAGKMQGHAARIKELDGEVEKAVAAYAASRHGPEADGHLATFASTWPAFKAARDEALAQSAAGKKAEVAPVVLGTVTTRYQAAQKPIDALAELSVTSADAAVKASQARYVVVWWLTVVAIVVGVTAAIGLGVLIARRLARALGDAVEVLEAVAGGDFTRRLSVQTHDEVGRMAGAVNEAVEGMKAALRDVRMSAREVALASTQLSQASTHLSRGAQEQASSLEETAAALEEITGTVKQNADNARQANQLATGSRDTADTGGRVVADAVQAMGEINASSRRIADIIVTIDEIAFQTNLLALNAAVEAARAGEQGRGFAVVAAEVRNLAQRSAGAAKEIKSLIQDSVQRVSDGSELVNRSGATLGEIVTSVKRVTDIIAEIASASQEQTTGIDQVNKAVSQMDQLAQSNAAQTEQLSSTAQALAAQAEKLQALVARFRLSDAHEPAATARGAAGSRSSRGLASSGAWPPAAAATWSTGGHPPAPSETTAERFI